MDAVAAKQNAFGSRTLTDARLNWRQVPLPARVENSMIQPSILYPRAFISIDPGRHVHPNAWPVPDAMLSSLNAGGSIGFATHC